MLCNLNLLIYANAISGKTIAIEICLNLFFEQGWGVSIYATIFVAYDVILYLLLA
jgi:hypothetical protein